MSGAAANFSGVLDRVQVPAIVGAPWKTGTVLDIEQRGCDWLGIRLEAPADSGLPARLPWQRALIEIDLEARIMTFPKWTPEPGHPEVRRIKSWSKRRVALDREGLRFREKGIQWQLGPAVDEGLGYRTRATYRELWTRYYKEYECTLIRSEAEPKTISEAPDRRR